jgi:hypothetical protein
MVTNSTAWGLVLRMVAMLSDYVKGLSVDSNPENSETQNCVFWCILFHVTQKALTLPGLTASS